MQNYKIEHFERDHPRQRFPPFHTLGSTQTIKLLAALAYGLATHRDYQEFVRYLSTHSQVVEGVSAESEKFDVPSLLQFVGIVPSQRVYLHWLGYSSTIVEVEYATLCQYFEYIWYPSSDDLFVFDDTLSWVLLITHEGEIHFISQYKT